ncbi:MAG: hypothetical protein GQ474_05900 [Sulfurimonas sp.]|nr:hypothetical protein [Sulfurimonas sp.]
MRIKSITPIKSIGRTKNKNPILKHGLQKEKLNKHLDKKTTTHKAPLTIREHGKAITLYKKYYSKGVSVRNALDHSLLVDINRARVQLKAFYIKTLQKDVFKFNVKASGLYQAKSHQVQIKWNVESKDLDKDPYELFLNAPIQFQCACGRHTYWYRYIWTIIGGGLGIQEHRFPSIKNPQAKGMLCKHGIKVIKTLHSTGFQNTFKRYISNKRVAKNTKISQKDKAKIAGQSFNS